MSETIGKVSQVIGPVVDVVFDGEQNIIPPIYTALAIEREGENPLILEVEQHIGEETARCVAMESTDGLQRGMTVKSMGHGIAVPTGDQIKGRLLNVTSISLRPSLTSSPSPPKYLPRASRSSTCSSHTRKAVKSASSAAPA